MNPEDRVRQLKAFPLFVNLPMGDLLVVAKEIKFQTIPANTVFINQEDVSNTVYFIVSGAIRIYRLTENGEEINISLGGPGTVVGEMALIDDVPRSANVEAIKESEVFVLTGEGFRRILKKFPEVAINLLKIFSQRLRENNAHMEEILSQTLTERTWKTLCALRKLFPNSEIKLSQEELSYIVGATRARITEALNTLQNEGKISLSHRKIQLL